MYVSADKQLVNVQKSLWRSSRFFQGKCYETFVISNFSASNVTLCRVLSGPGLDLFISVFNYTMRGMIWEGERE